MSKTGLPARRRFWRTGLGIGLATGAAGGLLLPGCTLLPRQDHRGPDAPDAAPLARAPRVAWVLGSGGPRGFVHVGVVKALAELGLRPDLIVGASVGAMVGTLCAAGHDAARLEREAIDLQAWQLVRWSPFGTQRWAATGLAHWVQQQVDHRPLEQLPVPMVCAVQRLRDGEVLGFNRGRAGLAVQASGAIEGSFDPVVIRGEAYADADLRMPLPVRLARALGAQRVLAVDASAHEDRAPAGAARYREADLRKRALTRPDAELADVLLHPDFGYWVSMSEDFKRRAIDAGYRATLAAAPALRALHAG